MPDPMRDELYNQFMEGFELPGDIPAMLQNIVEQPPDENQLRQALTFYGNRFDFPELTTAMQTGGVGAYDQSIEETLPAVVRDYLGQSAFNRQNSGGAEDYDEKQRQMRILLSLFQGGGAPGFPGM